MATFKFNVWLNSKLIDSVFYPIKPSQKKVDVIQDIKHSLVNHDGYDSEIKVTLARGQRLTETEYIIQGNYGQGWEDENTETNRIDARRSIKEYRENGSGNYRLITRLVRKG